MEGAAIWDDKGILGGAAIGGGSVADALTESFNYAYYRPLTSLSYAIDLGVYGPRTFGFHVTNVLLHWLATLAVAWLAYALTQCRGAALASGAFFAVQSAQIGATAWIGGRTDTLASLFVAMFAGSLVWGLRRRSEPGSRKGSSIAWILISVLSFFAAAMSKEQAAGMVLLVPFVAASFGGGAKKALVVSLPFFIASAFFAYLWLTSGVPSMSPAPAEVSDLLGRFLRTVVHYTGHFLTPSGWSLHSFTLANYSGAGWAVLGLVLVIAYGWGIWRLWNSNRMMGIAAIAAFLAFLPISNLVPLPSLLVGPYRVAVAGVFVAILLGWGLSLAIARQRWVAGVVLGAVFVWTVAIAPWGISRWKNEKTFFAEVHRHDPYSLVGGLNYLMALLQDNQAELALRTSKGMIDRSFKGWNGNFDVLPEMLPRVAESVQANNGAQTKVERRIGGLLYEHAIALRQTGRHSDADRAIRAAASIDPSNPDVVVALGDDLFESDPRGALQHYRRGVKLATSKYGVLVKIGRAHLKLGEYAEAAAAFRDAAERRPWMGATWVDLSDALEASGDIPGAVRALRRAEEGFLFDPNEVKAKREALTRKFWERARSTSPR